MSSQGDVNCFKNNQMDVLFSNVYIFLKAAHRGPLRIANCDVCNV